MRAALADGANGDGGSGQVGGDRMGHPLRGLGGNFGSSVLGLATLALG